MSDVVPWDCTHAFCPAHDPRAGCPWWIDASLLVHCDRRSPAHAGPRLHQGGPDDPPMVLRTCRVQAASPVVLASGRPPEPTR